MLIVYSVIILDSLLCIPFISMQLQHCNTWIYGLARPVIESLEWIQHTKVVMQVVEHCTRSTDDVFFSFCSSLPWHVIDIASASDLMLPMVFEALNSNSNIQTDSRITMRVNEGFAIFLLQIYNSYSSNAGIISLIIDVCYIIFFRNVSCCTASQWNIVITRLVIFK